MAPGGDALGTKAVRSVALLLASLSLLIAGTATLTAEEFRTPAVSAVKPDRPSANAYQARENIRQQVMAERGVDLLDLYRMGSLRRIRTEAAIAAETADRTRRAQQPGLGTLIDLRV